jgi:hypothetical protein
MLYPKEIRVDSEALDSYRSAVFVHVRLWRQPSFRSSCTCFDKDADRYGCEHGTVMMFMVLVSFAVIGAIEGVYVCFCQRTHVVGYSTQCTKIELNTTALLS